MGITIRYPSRCLGDWRVIEREIPAITQFVDLRYISVVAMVILSNDDVLPPTVVAMFPITDATLRSSTWRRDLFFSK